MTKNLKKAAAIAAVAFCGSFATGAAAATWTVGQWYQFAGNDYYYYSVQQIVPVDGQGGWTIARDQAAGLSAPGAAATLATIDSAALDAFIFAGIDSAAFWTLDTAGNNEGPYLGGYQTSKDAEPAGNWAWVNDDPWSYTQWTRANPIIPAAPRISCNSSRPATTGAATGMTAAAQAYMAAPGCPVIISLNQNSRLSRRCRNRRRGRSCSLGSASSARGCAAGHAPFPAPPVSARRVVTRPVTAQRSGAA